MGIKIKIILAAFMIISVVSTVEAAWQGPVTLISGSWGENNNQFGIDYGDTNDLFGGPYYILLDGKIILTDLPNGRIKLYGANGELLKVVKCVKDATGEWNEECRIPVLDYIQTTSDGNIWVGPSDFLEQQGYSLYSSGGKLVKTVTERPIELGYGKEEVLDTGRYKTTITYDDRVYVIISDKEYDYYSRDSKKNLYERLPGLVDKFSPCGKRLARLLLPEDVVYKGATIKGQEPEIFTHDEYGPPQVDINGNVYAWKRTPSAYSILKWTWVDDPNIPAGPDAPTNLTIVASINGIYLTWKASPQDPGCVTAYEIYRATSAGGAGTTAGTVSAGKLNYNDMTATAGTTYYYKIRAVSGSEYSPYTSETSGKR